MATAAGPPRPSPGNPFPAPWPGPPCERPVWCVDICEACGSLLHPGERVCPCCAQALAVDVALMFAAPLVRVPADDLMAVADAVGVTQGGAR